jgi:hypothetical protein
MLQIEKDPNISVKNDSPMSNAQTSSTLCEEILKSEYNKSNANGSKSLLGKKREYEHQGDDLNNIYNNYDQSNISSFNGNDDNKNENKNFHKMNNNYNNYNGGNSQKK